MALGRVLDRVAPGLPSRLVLFSSSVVQLTVVISFALLLLVDLGILGAGLARRLTARRTSPGTTAEPAPVAGTPEVDTTAVPRRAVLTQIAVGSAFLVGGSSSLYGALLGRHDYTIEELPVRLPGLSKELDGFTIVQLSDIHVGSFVGDAELEAGFEFVRRAKPDLVVLTGDLIDHDPRVAERLGAFARRLVPLAREGVTAITGNHDFYAGVDETVSALERAGAQVLRNQGRVIGGAKGFALLGVDDVWAKRFNPGAGPDLGQAVRTLPKVEGRHVARDLPRVLLCHNPSYFEQAAGHVDLQMSGHTHGGQVNLVVRPGELFLKNGWIAGLYERSGSRLYVNRGFGTVGPPARVGAPPEISRIVLTSA
jgi:predicted MPP superfamily phosphohydrolase